VDQFGAAMRRLREARGLSLRALSAQVSYDHGYLGQIERGKRHPTQAVAAAVDRALHADGTLMVVYEEATVEGEMQRRAVLRGLSALAVGSPTMIALEALRQGIGVSLDADHDSWEQVAADYGRAFYTTPHEQLLQHLVGDLTVLQQMIAGQTGRRRRALTRAAGQLSVIVAMALAASGQSHVAARWWTSAQHAADEAADLDTQILVRSWMVVSGGYERRPLPDLIMLADETAAMVAGRATSAVAGLHAGRAQALARAGRYDDAIAAVDAVETVTARIPADVARDEESLFGWPEHRLLHTQSYVYTHVGELDAAANAQDRALTLYPASQARLRTQVALHRAACLIKDGHVSDGLRYAADLLDDLPREHHNTVLYEVARQVLATVPAVERARPEVGDLRLRLEAGPAV
jgi:transcriptional regulator with XRE-family HTH domain